jgi:iron complex outermembrane receptor protein
VINVITRTGAQKGGWQLESYGGSLSTRGAVASFGHVFSNHSELLASVSAHRSAGDRRLYFPEFDNGDPGSGVVRDRDGDETASGFVSLAVGRLTLRGGAAGRLKQVPTAAFGTIVGDDRANTEDRRRFVNATYNGPIAGGFNGAARVAYDSYHYVGSYPYGGDTPYLWRDGADSHALAGELTVTRRLAGRHNVTAGTELRRFLRNQQWASDESGRALDVNDGGTVVGLYAQDEARVARWLLVNAGARLDRYPTFGARLTPRVGMVLLPRPQTAIKLLRGHAFRAPNSYELNYYDAMRERRHTLTPEQFKATEVVWEEHLSKQVRATLSWYDFHAYDLVEQRSLSEIGDQLYFVNGGHVEGSGLEAEVEARLARGVRARYSQSYAHVHDRIDGHHPPNSPRHLAKVGLEAPIWGGLTGALEAQYVGSRATLDGTALPAVFTPNLVVTSAGERRAAITVGLYNAFNTSYGDPGAEEHQQRSIPQDGRTVLARLRVGF